jgi:hypothetical protein
MIQSFAEQTYESFYHQNRNIDTIIDNIYVGKMGEYGSALLFNASLPLFEACADPGYDFIINDICIDVKTIDAYYKQRVYISRLSAQCYVAMYLNKKTNEVKYLGNLSRLYIRKYKLLQNGYIDKNIFKKHFKPVFIKE